MTMIAGVASATQFARARYEGKAHLPNCGSGGFPDLAGKCWECPEGFKHANFLLPPQHDKVCRADTRFSAGVKHAPAAVGCPTGQWPSLHNGYCYSCPDDYQHNILYNGDDQRVCAKQQEVTVAYATGLRHGKTVLGLGCPKGQWPSLHNGRCYTCPDGYAHDMARNGDDARVCYRRSGGGTAQNKGTRHAKANVGLCPSGQWVSLHDQACYTCPADYQHDSARSGNDAQVCYRRQERFSRAARSGGLLCDRGFFDPVRGGSCWTCPADAGIRTVARVDGERACTDKISGIVAVDVCKPLVAGLREGQKGLASVQDILLTIIGPVLQPLNRAAEQVTAQVRSPKELDALLERLGEPLRPHGKQLDELQRLQSQLDRAGDSLSSAILDPDLVCGGDMRAFDRKLSALGLQPKFTEKKTGWFDNWPIGTAHAGTKSAHVAFSTALELGNIGSPVNSFVLTIVTNFQGQGGVFLSIGRIFTTDPSGSVSVGVMLFPSAEIDDFDQIQELGAEISVDTDQIRKMFRNEGATASAATPSGSMDAPVPPDAGRTASAKVPDAVDVSFDPRFQSVPGFGVSKDLGKFGRAASGKSKGSLPVSLSIDWTVKLR